MILIEDLERRLPPHLLRWAPQLISAELCFGIDPYTLAAILDRESRGGDALTPKGPTGKGDRGFGHGLFQIDARTHGSFLSARGPDGIHLWKKPSFSALYAADLIHTNLRASGGDLLLSIAAYNCGLKRAKFALDTKLKPGATEDDRIAALDSVTTGEDYVSDVLRRRSAFLFPPDA